MLSVLAVLLSLMQVFVFNQASIFGGVMVVLLPLIYILKNELHPIEVVFATLLCAYCQSLFLPPSHSIRLVVAALVCVLSGLLISKAFRRSRFAGLLAKLDLPVSMLVMSAAYWLVLVAPFVGEVATALAVYLILLSSLLAIVVTVMVGAIVRRLG